MQLPLFKYVPTISAVYSISNTKNGKRYVGSAVNVLHRCWRHLRELNRGTHGNPHLQNAWKKYGQENFFIEILEPCAVPLLEAQEDFYINSLRARERDRGYNVLPADRRGTSLPQEMRNRIALSLAGRERSQAAINKAIKTHAESVKNGWVSPLKGRKLPLSQRRKMGRPGVPKPVGFGGRVSASLSGLAKTPEHCRHISEAKMGHSTGIGRHLSNATKDAIRKKLQEQRQSEATKVKRRATWAAKRVVRLLASQS